MKMIQVALGGKDSYVKLHPADYLTIHQIKLTRLGPVDLITMATPEEAKAITKLMGPDGPIRYNADRGFYTINGQGWLGKEDGKSTAFITWYSRTEVTPFFMCPHFFEPKWFDYDYDNMKTFIFDSQQPEALIAVN